MRNYLLLSTFGILVACGGSSGSEKTPTSDRAQTSVNQAPSVSLQGNTLINAGDTLSLTTSVSDPENDTVTGEWTSSLPGVKFVAASNTLHHVIFPDVNEQTEVTLTYTVTDSHENRVSKTWQVTVMPNSTAGYIELADTLTLYSGGHATITANFAMSSDIEKIEWRTNGIELANQSTSSHHDTRAGSSTFSIDLPDVSQVQQFDIEFEITTSDKVLSKTIKVTLSSSTEPALSVSLPEQFSVKERSSLTIKPDIANSDEIIAYEWQWQGTPQPSQHTQGKLYYTFKAPEVNESQTFKLLLTVTMKGNIKKTAETAVTVQNVTDLNGIELTMDRLSAVPGQTITVTSNLTNFDDVDSVSWNIHDFSDDLLQKSNNKLIITIPDESTFQTSKQIEYTVTLKDGSEKTAFAEFGYISSSAAKSLLQIKDPDPFSLYPDLSATLVLEFSGPIDVDEVTVTSNDYDPYESLEWSLDGQYLTLKLRKKTITRKGLTSIRITAKAGDVVRESLIMGTTHSALVAPYGGVDETYVLGSEAQVFGQVFHLNDKTDMPSHWQIKSYEDSVTLKQVSDTSTIVKYSGDTSDNVTLEFNATDEYDNASQSEVRLKFDNTFLVQGDTYYCKISDSKLEYCRERSSTRNLDLVAPTELKQVITRGDYACLLGNYGAIVCNAKGDNPAKHVPPQLLATKLNAVDASNVCAQLSDASWRCWGSRGTELTELMAAHSIVHKVLANDTHTCLVSNQDIACYDGKTRTRLIEDAFPRDLTLFSREICYRTDVNILNCDIE
ncbi:hypothetical protein [Pseudoalteromonas sp. R3]|uniref:hypothetical protein n=1 Tax=Pseudoalteromonas sp. R3 TaxID=1709477 RepID=UPI0006B480FC|nr:hypothetical protein [Pseudoalteromonas sp. R3]AZZ97884.1 hypothetical protein ELR70_12665 [Pseudoalteromonas sp. R3]